nr:uncharacterized protein LOC101259453 isoform X4 [Solanum lycopersicum]
MEKKILPSSSGGYDIASCGTHLGQRISRPVDLPVFSLTPESSLKGNGPLLFTTEENTRESIVNQSKSASVVAHGDSFQHQFNHQNSVEGYTSNSKAQENEVKSMNQYSSCMQLQSTQHQHPLWKYDFPIGEAPDSLNWVSETNNMLAQADTGRSSSKSDNSYTGKSQIHPQLGYLISGNPDVTSRMSFEMHNVSTGGVREFGAVEQISSQHHSSYASSHGRGCPEEANRFGNSCVSDQSLKCSNRSGLPCWWDRDILLRGSASTDQKAGGKSLQTKAQNSIGSFDNRVDTLESRGTSHMEGDMKKDVKSIDKSIHRSHRLNEKSRLLSNKMSPAAEKIWEGSLQLSSSITASVVAFFRSGEKLLDVKWPEFVEARGGVKFVDFKSYVRDLRGSGSRTLTVVSICLKEGASVIELEGMKAAVKDYMRCGRVGRAKISPDVTIYLCPPSNEVFIVLEKYGFLKGTAAVEGNSQLMIGCVVWQKSQTALTSVLKKSEEKANSLQEQLQKSLSDSSMLQGGGQGSLSVPSVENSDPSAPLSSFSNIEVANVTDNKNIGIDSASRTTLTASGVKSPPFQQKKSEFSGSHLLGSKGHLSSIEASYVHQSNDEPPKESRNLPKPVISLLSNASKRKMAFPDGEDLPEFDFGTASGISSSSHHSYGSIIGNRLQLSGSRILGMSKQPTRLVAPSACMTIPRSVISISKEMPLARNVNDYSQLVTASRQMEEKHYSQSHAIPVTVPVCAYGSSMVPFHSSGKKNLFNDADMPEWLPPDAQNERTNEPPKTFPPEYSTLRMLLPLPTGSVFPYPSSAPIRNSFSSQPSPLYHLPANSSVPPPIPSQKGASNLTGFTFNPVPRPQSSSRAAASSWKPADKEFRMLHLLIKDWQVGSKHFSPLFVWKRLSVLAHVAAPLEPSF